jgi:hypothetical protein
MDSDLDFAIRTLPRRALQRVAARPGRRIECVRGTLWLTIDHDRRDIVLRPGQGFVLDRDDDMLLSALADSAYLVLDSRPL